MDLITLEIQWQRLISIMDEVDNATVRTSFSTIVGESRDFACILVDEAGSSLCQSNFSPPNFCVVLPRTSKVLLEKFPELRIYPLLEERVRNMLNASPPPARDPAKSEQVPREGAALPAKDPASP